MAAFKVQVIEKKFTYQAEWVAYKLQLTFLTNFNVQTERTCTLQSDLPVRLSEILF